MQLVCGLEDCIYDDSTDKEISYPSWPNCVGCRYACALYDMEQSSDMVLEQK